MGSDSSHSLTHCFPGRGGAQGVKVSLPRVGRLFWEALEGNVSPTGLVEGNVSSRLPGTWGRQGGLCSRPELLLPAPVCVKDADRANPPLSLSSSSLPEAQGGRGRGRSKVEASGTEAKMMALSWSGP